MSGNYVIDVLLGGEHIRGSPFALSIITLRPEASRCLVRGDGLYAAVSRKPQKFEVDFVDALGDPAFAEELDVYVERVGDIEAEVKTAPAEPVPLVGAALDERLAKVGKLRIFLSNASGLASADLNGKSDPYVVFSCAGQEAKSTIKPKTLNPAWNETFEMVGILRKFVASGLLLKVFDCDNPLKPEKDESLGRAQVSLDCLRQRDTSQFVESLSTGSEGEIAKGKIFFGVTWVPPTSIDSPSSDVGGSEVRSSYHPLDAFARQRHETLWALRSSLDKWLAKSAAERTSKKKQFSLVPSTAHELSTADPFGFAFGGLSPGLLHSHGRLSKTHTVLYSIGLAGRYKLHIGLRQQHVPLPGSPFALEVRPGAASAILTTIPRAERELRGMVDEGWQQGLRLRLSDQLGNACIEGGASVSVGLHKVWLNAHPEMDQVHVENQPVQWRVLDQSDGTYKLDYCCCKLGAFPVEVTVDGEPVCGSPIVLIMRAAQPELSRFVLSGAGLKMATAGELATVSIKVHDRFGNVADPGEAPSFGLALVSVDRTMDARGARGGPRADGKSNPKTDKGSAPPPPGSTFVESRGRKDDQYKGFKGDSMELTSERLVDGYVLRYTPRESGTFDLHMWVVVEGNVKGSERVALPGSPFPVQVQMGSASAAGSFVNGTDATPVLGVVPTFAGEKLIVRPQLRDLLGNPTVAPVGNGAFFAFHQPPVGELVQLETPKPKGGVGAYEVQLEPTIAGTHTLHVQLHGHEISGSPLRFEVMPAPFGDSHGVNKSVSRCTLCRLTEAAADINEMCMVLLTIIDRYGNKVTKGGHRIEAKGFGSSASPCAIEDLNDGTYKIAFTAAAPGEVKLQVKVEGSEVAPISAQFVRRSTVLGSFGFSKKSGLTPSMSHMEAFSMLAKDGRDSISISDLRSTLTKDGSSKVSEADIQSLLSQVGVTGDGELRIEEFERLWKSFQSPNSKEAVKQTGAAAAAPTEGAPIIAPRGSLPILPTAAPKPTPAVAPAAKPAAVKSAVEIGAKFNEAFVFIKPHANNAEVQNLVRAKFVEKGIEIVSEGEIGGATIDANGFIDQHYYSIASKATLCKPADLNVPAAKFAEFFGEEWVDVLAEERALNAIDFKEKLGLSAEDLNAKWDATGEPGGKRFKFGGGFYCGMIEHDGKPYYTFNAFFMRMRGKFTSSEASIHYFAVRFAPSALRWKDFRGNVLGPTDPSKAPPESLRGTLFSGWEGFGLASAPNTGDNCVHASASPFEGLCERQNWLKTTLIDDEFGKALLAAGVSEAFIKAGTVDPQVVLPGGEGKMGSFFDQLEDLDFDECLAKVRAIADVNAAYGGGVEMEDGDEAVEDGGLEAASDAAAEGAPEPDSSPAGTSSLGSSKLKQMKKKSAAKAAKADAASSPSKEVTPKGSQKSPSTPNELTPKGTSKSPKKKGKGKT